ncbi:hypothetical protein, variant [Puccinia triticina 1-1 BBBD Race 1]|nr:hypothetical protein, variant [Puccinia triticina 1-1 BBBD Race 1]
MAKLSDLPVELVQRIINCTIHPQVNPSLTKDSDTHHHLADHNGIGGTQQPPRPHALVGSDASDLTGRKLARADSDAQIDHNAPTEPEVSWPEALPSNPLLPLALVNHPFRECAQETLFKNVTLVNQCQAHVFHRALTCPYKEDTSGHTEINSPRMSQLASQVRSLNVKWSGYCSMGIGGGSVFCDIIRSCPLLENIAISSTFLTRCKDPILDALASRRHIKDFVVLQDHKSSSTTFQWPPNELVDRLFSRWKFLETVELIKLPGQRVREIAESIHRPITLPVSTLRTLILKHLDLDEMELAMIIRSCKESMRTLHLIRPSGKLDRAGLCRILKECTSPYLETLTIDVDVMWHMPSLTSTNAAGIIDIVLSSLALSQLKSLSITGSLTGSQFFSLLPQSIIKLAWESSGIPPAPFIKALSSWRDSETHTRPLAQPRPQSDSAAGGNGRVQWLPNLKCCSVRVGRNWRKDVREVVRNALEARSACFHCACRQHFQSWDEQWDIMALEQDTGQSLRDMENEHDYDTPGSSDYDPNDVDDNLEEDTPTDDEDDEFDDDW